MSAFSAPVDNCSRSSNYDAHKDIHVSIMDYDAGGKAQYQPDHIGFWGRPDGIESPQPYYISKWDIDHTTPSYGSFNYYPILAMELHKDWNNIDYHGNFCGYATTSWETVNCNVRAYQFPTDLRGIFGLSWKSQSSTGNTRTEVYLWYNSTYHTFFVSATSPGSSWVKKESLGWWEKNQSSKSIIVGNKTRTATTIPLIPLRSTSWFPKQPSGKG
jgi:hypothetical protein